MSKLKLSNSQRDLYVQCPKKYFFRYIRKMRSKSKGSALFFGGAFDHACEFLLNERNLSKAKIEFTERWMAQENNRNCKFAKADYVDKILNSDDVAKLTACIDNLNHSKAKEDYATHRDTLRLVKDIKKLGESSFARPLTNEEEKYLHFANVLCMNRKGLLMLQAFNDKIMPHITEVVGTQISINIPHPDGHSVGGLIDLVAKMEGYKMPDGRVLTKEDNLVLDVKSAGATYWAKLDDLTASDQLDSYLISDAVQSLGATNLIGYLAVSKQISTVEESVCKLCNNKKVSAHKTCNAEINTKRCGGEWNVLQEYYCEAKIVVGERDLNQAGLMLDDYSDVLAGIINGVFPRNRGACDAYGSVCEYSSVCGRCPSKELEDSAIEIWKRERGE